METGISNASVTRIALKEKSPLAILAAFGLCESPLQMGKAKCKLNCDAGYRRCKNPEQGCEDGCKQ
jgi:hypothetical protein